jgi:hypothetical protein
MGNIISTVKGAQPEAQFAVTQHCDPPEDPFDVLQDLTASDAAAQDAVDGITLCDGGDQPEAQLNALWEIGDGGVSEPTGSTTTVRRRGSPLRQAPLRLRHPRRWARRRDPRGLQNLPAEVSANVVCDTGLSIAFDPALPQTVPSGDDAVLDEAITVVSIRTAAWCPATRRPGSTSAWRPTTCPASW